TLTYEHTLTPSAVQGLTAADDATGRSAAAVYEDPLSRSTTFTLDARGRLERVDRPLGVTERFELNAAGQAVRSIDPLNRRTTYSYDGSGDLTRANYHDGTHREFGYHPTFHKLTRERDERGNETAYEYNPRGDLIRREDALHRETKYRYYEDGSGQSS